MKTMNSRRHHALFGIIQGTDTSLDETLTRIGFGKFVVAKQIAVCVAGIATTKVHRNSLINLALEMFS